MWTGYISEVSCRHLIILLLELSGTEDQRNTYFKLFYSPSNKIVFQVPLYLIAFQNVTWDTIGVQIETFTGYLVEVYDNYINNTNCLSFVTLFM